MIKLRENNVNKAYHKNPKIIATIGCCITTKKCTLAPSYDSQTSNPLYDLDHATYRSKATFPLSGVESTIIGTVYISNHT